jgi:hypothetical protein
MLNPANVAKQFQEQPAAAVAEPVDPRATGYEAPGDVGAAGTLEIQLDGYAVTLAASHAAVKNAVATAYLIGGFDLVRALDRQVRYRVSMETLTLQQLDTAVKTLPGQASVRPALKDVYDRALSEQLAKIPATRRRLQIATDIRGWLQQSWTRIAAAEEQVLREYEPRLIAQFVDLAKDARALALREWARYEPYDTSKPEVLPISTTEAKERDIDDLRLRKEAPELVKAIRELYVSWKDYLDALESTRTLVGLGPSRVRSASGGADPEEMVANSRAYNARKFEAFDNKRTEIGTTFPVALQVYGRIGRRASDNILTTDETIHGWVIEALIDAVASSQELAYQAVMNPVFRPGERLRVDPADGSKKASALPGYQQDALADGLTIPASRIIANRLADIDDAAQSPWLQLPVRLALFKRGKQGEEMLAPYTTPGRLHHAALSEVNNALQEVRRKQKEKVDQALLVINAIALPAGFFTGGATVAIAGVIHALVRGREMYMTVAEYQARDALAQIALVPMQQAIWEHPSTVILAGKLLEGGFEIATDLVNGGIAGAFMDAIQISLTLGYGVEAVAAWAASDDPLDNE